MWLSPTRPGFDSRRGNIFLLQRVSSNFFVVLTLFLFPHFISTKKNIYIGSTGTWTRIVRIRTWSANQLHYRTIFLYMSIKKTCLDRGSNTGPLDLQSNALPTELSKQVTNDATAHIVLISVGWGSRDYFVSPYSYRRPGRNNSNKKREHQKNQKREAYWRIWTIDLSLTKRMLYP